MTPEEYKEKDANMLKDIAVKLEAKGYNVEVTEDRLLVEEIKIVSSFMKSHMDVYYKGEKITDGYTVNQLIQGVLHALTKR